MKSLYLSLFVFLFACIHVDSQELFPNSEPASNVPKGVLGVRVIDETYKELSLLRDLTVLRVMYGVLPKLSVSASVSMSNHHGVDFPPNLVSHTHPKNQPSVYTTGNFVRGIEYPYLYNGVDLYAKYRFLTIDGQGQHFRMAAYGEWSNINVAHDESEPTLLDDTKGYGGGLITTFLKNRVAVSLTTGFIIPGSYQGLSPDLLGGPLVPTKVQYGRAVNYDLSIGYRLLPLEYKNYDQVNINLYVEFMGKSYDAASVTQYYFVSVPIKTPLLEAGNYVEAYPGIQAIFNSNLRVDFSVGFPVINQSYVLYPFYPVYTLGIQRYFYFKKQK